MSELHDAETAGRSSFLSAFKRACKANGHTFKPGFTSHGLNDGVVEMAVTAIKKPKTFDEWSGKLQVTVSAGGYPVLMSKSWRGSNDEWSMEEILAHALTCAAHNKTKKERYISNYEARRATTGDGRFEAFETSARERGGHLEVTDGGKLRLTFDGLDFARVAALLDAASPVVEDEP